MAKKKKSANSGKGFNFSEFLLFHVEKIIFALIALLSLTLVYLGVAGQRFPASKSPDDLQKKAEQALNNAVKQDHWEAIVEAEPDRTVTVSYSTIAKETRGEVSAGNYLARIWKETNSNKARRTDPALKAPIKLRGQYISGIVAEWAKGDPLANYQDAKKEEKEAPRPRRNNRGGPGFPGGMGSEDSGLSAGGMMGAGSSSGSSMLGGGIGPGSPGQSLFRKLQAAYDNGFKPAWARSFYTQKEWSEKFGIKTLNNNSSSPTGTNNANVLPPMAARNFSVVAVTAIVEHLELENAYKEAFQDIPEFKEGRDNPYYQRFEVQRAEVTSDNQVLTDKDWTRVQAAEVDKWFETFKPFAGMNQEVNNSAWTVPTLSMPIPPFLIKDYRDFCSHPDIPSNRPEIVRDDDPIAGQMGSGGGMYGGSEMSGMSGMGGGDSYGSPMMGGSMDSSGGLSSSSGSGSMSSDYGDGMSMGMGAGSNLLPKRLPPTKYKLIRFFDQTAEAKKSYRYRVRLVMYDPNFPEYEMFAPRPMNLDQAALTRIQELRMTVKADSTTGKRVSERFSDWSEPTDVIVALSPTAVFAGELDSKGASYMKGALPNEYVESKPVKTEVAIQNPLGPVMVSIKDKDAISRGQIVTNGMKTKDGNEFIHPITKVLKIFKRKREEVIIAPPLPNVVVSIVDVGGGVPLFYNSTRDELKSGGEVVAFDSTTGQLVVAREFEDYTDYAMTVKPDEPPIGPLGGGMAGAAGGYGGMESGGMDSGGGMLGGSPY